MRVVSDTPFIGTFPLVNVDEFQDDDILFIYDSFDESLLDKLTGKRGQPRAVVNDSFTFIEQQFPYPIYCANIWLETHINKFRHLPMTLDPTTEINANFIINKKQINRYLAIKLVEHFEIPVDYTWSGIGNTFDMSAIIDEWQSVSLDSIPQNVRNFLLSPITLPARWIDYRGISGNGSGVVTYGGNVWTWTNGIDQVVSKSAVSIITESIWTQNAMHFTEKTLYAILGLTFPLWIGGYRQAESWKLYGFDAFDDVINHDYQYYPTLIERCWWAIALNLEILKDLDTLKKLRKKHLDRLISNRDKIFGDQMRNYNDSVISTWPIDIQQSMSTIFRSFRNK
jgi:hypothetical protein